MHHFNPDQNGKTIELKGMTFKIFGKLNEVN